METVRELTHNEPAEIVLSKLKFLKDDQSGTLRATVGGVVLAAEDPRDWLPNAYIQAVCYEANAWTVTGNSMLRISADLSTGRYWMRCALSFATGASPPVSNLPVVTCPNTSERAVFEAVVNAVVHRDYAVSGSKIRLFMFDSRLELYSPGGLSNSMTTEDLRTSQFTRNELLASRLGQCPAGDVPGAGGRQYFIERRGEGIAVIEDETFALSGKKPVFELIGERELKLVLPAASPPLPNGIAARISIHHHDTGEPLQDVHILLIYPNKTYQEERTDAFGHADFDLHTRCR